jgi:AmmeMemoRadiSam system protein B
MYLRSPQFAGTFYPDNSQILKEMIEDFLHQATVEKLKVQPKALIVPHAGYIHSGQVAAYGFKILEDKLYKKIILLGPSHHFSFQGLASSPSGYWETPLGRIECLGKENLKELKKTKEIIESSEIHEPEHCLEVEIPFLQTVLKDFKIVSFLTGELNIKTIVKILEPLVNEEALILVSSDLSHYYSYKEAQKLDKVTIDAILDNDFKRLEEFGEACGKTGIDILLEIAKNKHWQPKLLKALNSGDITGEKSQVVGYASIVYL